MVGEAQRSAASAASNARLALIERYQGAAYRYLLGAVHDANVADELFQEFALSVLQGAFRHADPERGRFRDYLKTALIHLVFAYRNRQRRQPVPLGSAVAEAAAAEDAAASDEQFVCSWREELLARTWARLEEAECHGDQPYYSVLKFRSENPDASSAEMAKLLSEQLSRKVPFTEPGVRKALQRARVRFANVLVEEVAASLENPTRDELEQELVDLQLLSYCRSALQRWS